GLSCGGLLGRRSRLGGLGGLGGGLLRRLESLGDSAAGDHLLEVGARPERRHRGLAYPHRLAGAGVASHTSGTSALLEDSEPGDGHFVALGDRCLDLRQDRFQSRTRRAFVPQTHGERFNKLGLVHDFPPIVLTHNESSCATLCLLTLTYKHPTEKIRCVATPWEQWPQRRYWLGVEPAAQRAAGSAEPLGHYWLEGGSALLVSADVALVAQRQANVVQTLHQPPPAEVVDGEWPLGVGSPHHTGFEVHRQEGRRF